MRKMPMMLKKRRRTVKRKPSVAVSNMLRGMFVQDHAPMKRKILSMAAPFFIMTQARGSFTMRFEKYEEVPTHLANKIIEAHKAEEEE